MASWLSIEESSEFSLDNLPFGIFSTRDQPQARIGVALGDYVIDMSALVQEHVFDSLQFDTSTLEKSTLNEYAALSRSVHARVRRRLQELLTNNSDQASMLQDDKERRSRCLLARDKAIMHLPVSIDNFTDFFVGLHHAVNSAKFLKPGAQITDILPGFWDMPTAYHGRSSSVFVSGTPIYRPCGQIREEGKAVVRACRMLDFEVELAAVIGAGSEMGKPVNVEEAENHIFGFVLLNDWSARDFQKHEYAPFSCKNFATTISPWIVPFEALEPYRVAPNEANRSVPSYLAQKRTISAYDIPIEVMLKAGHDRFHISECNSKHVIFSFAQMIAHQTIGGCPLRTGDLLATGTLSGPGRHERGCFMEMSQDNAGANFELTLANSVSEALRRTYLEDGDVVEFSTQIPAASGYGKVGFGTCEGQILPAPSIL